GASRSRGPHAPRGAVLALGPGVSARHCEDRMIGLLSGWRGYALAAALAFAAAWAAQGWRWNADVATRERDQVQQIADAQALARATEQRRWAAREEIINDAKTQAAAAAADADRARAASERL